MTLIDLTPEEMDIIAASVAESFKSWHPPHRKKLLLGISEKMGY